MPRQARGERIRGVALDTAIGILTASGYTALTTRAVQEAAEMSRGSFLHQFPTREDLLAAVIEELVERRAHRAQTIIDRFAVEPPADRLTAAIGAVRELFSGPDFLAEMELWAAARTNPNLHATLVPVVERISRRLRAQLAELFGPKLTAHPDYPRVAMLTVEIARGLAFSAPIRRGTGDTTLLDYWCDAAAAMLGTTRARTTPSHHDELPV
ncbi:TetR family transcriptional regulator [Herbihabitans rhizosphaerae]|uniref:TetR family transcriptional regulator n=1 Tax=Herbihabitans rhizosphaerae TaxID=1872711 RepID=A0A4Q7L8J3_9PSEU|nr:TetR/AcrR family transcriptional regulator [Herbihabitans rhizosphaerae]RZS44722.1 TetR family transcriptional regulator [Herbihabitans rhizosphaerae]